MNIWRVAGMVLLAGLALFLVTLILKVLLIAAVGFLIIRLVGGYIARRAFGSARRDQWIIPQIISIDNPAYRTPVYRANYERIVPIN